MFPIAAGHVDTTVLAAFAVGFISFVSPCVLPLVPGYLSAISGVSFAELSEGTRRAHVLGPALLFCLSFAVMFEALLRRASTGGPVIAGLAFAVAWLPCTGPTLGAILTAASTESTVGKGGVLLAFYAAGLAVPFILSALAFTRVTGVFRFFRDHYTVITAVSGVILVVMGVLLFTNELARLNSEALKLLDNLGINFFQNV